MIYTRRIDVSPILGRVECIELLIEYYNDILSEDNINNTGYDRDVISALENIRGKYARH